MQIQATSNDIIFARKTPFFDDVPLFIPSNADKKKTRPKRKPQDEHAPRMVTIKELSELTGLSQYCIRGLCKQGIIKCIKAGTKSLINYEKFLEYMNREL
ncbi:MAG: helix-turn-helix domain-containing protein [Agathobacter sp.]|nr:helix-turn-helix domain-containing protein [Agathobacter sp.]